MSKNEGSVRQQRHNPESLLDLAKCVHEGGKRRLADDTARAATSGDVRDLRCQARALKKYVADLALGNRLLAKSMIAYGGGHE